MNISTREVHAPLPKIYLGIVGRREADRREATIEGMDTTAVPQEEETETKGQKT